MAGNVNEWVFDVYRPLSFQDMDDLNPVRRSREDLVGRSTADPNMDDPASGYDYEFFNSLISDKTRVYKGGSWRDRAYWLSPGEPHCADCHGDGANEGEFELEKLSTDNIASRVGYASPCPSARPWRVGLFRAKRSWDWRPVP